PRTARRFPPHSLLRPPRQWRTRREYRASTSAAQRLGATGRAQRRRRRRAAVALASLPLLWRAYDCHRDLRARRHATISPNSAQPDRQLVIVTVWSPRPNVPSLLVVSAKQ